MKVHLGQVAETLRLIRKIPAPTDEHPAVPAALIIHAEAHRLGR